MFLKFLTQFWIKIITAALDTLKNNIKNNFKLFFFFFHV